jgi:hypothetical protein
MTAESEEYDRTSHHFRELASVHRTDIELIQISGSEQQPSAKQGSSSHGSAGQMIELPRMLKKLAEALGTMHCFNVAQWTGTE